jgi:hypothetical protein
VQRGVLLRLGTRGDGPDGDDSEGCRQPATLHGCRCRSDPGSGRAAAIAGQRPPRHPRSVRLHSLAHGWRAGCRAHQEPLCDASRSAQSEHSATAGPGPSAISRSSPVHRSNAAPPEAAPAEPVTIAAAAPNASSSSGAGVAGPATVASSAAAQNPRPAGGSPITRNAPVLVLPLVPMPSQPTVLGPVPLVVPAIGGVAGPAGGALPWVWFVALGAVDLGLAAGILLRRRRRSGGAG